MKHHRISGVGGHQQHEKVVSAREKQTAAAASERCGISRRHHRAGCGQRIFLRRYRCAHRCLPAAATASRVGRQGKARAGALAPLFRLASPLRAPSAACGAPRADVVVARTLPWRHRSCGVLIQSVVRMDRRRASRTARSAERLARRRLRQGS